MVDHANPPRDAARASYHRGRSRCDLQETAASLVRRNALLSGDRIISIIRSNEFSTLPVIYFSSKPDHILAALASKSQPASFTSKSKGLPALVQKIRQYTDN
jgi:hypothetical protein